MQPGMQGMQPGMQGMQPGMHQGMQPQFSRQQPQFGQSTPNSNQPQQMNMIKQNLINQVNDECMQMLNGYHHEVNKQFEENTIIANVLNKTLNVYSKIDDERINQTKQDVAKLLETKENMENILSEVSNSDEDLMQKIQFNNQ